MYRPSLSNYFVSYSKYSLRSLQLSSSKHRRKNTFKDNFLGEFRKARPPTFDGQIKSRKEVEAWLLGMRKYFQVHDYFGNMKVSEAYSVIYTTYYQYTIHNNIQQFNLVMYINVIKKKHLEIKYTLSYYGLTKVFISKQNLVSIAYRRVLQQA